MADDGQQDLVAVDPQVVDAGLRDGRRLAHEARDAGTGHLEGEDSSTIARTAADGGIFSAAPRMSR